MTATFPVGPSPSLRAEIEVLLENQMQMKRSRRPFKEKECFVEYEKDAYCMYRTR